MPRIVAGVAKGRRLAAPAHGTRPTSDRAREALYSSLAGLLDIDGARVLDLFAGTGAVGLEARSRGAGHVTFVESDRAAYGVLRRNIEVVGLDGLHPHCGTAAGYLVGSGIDGPFDLVFADPPYAFGEEPLAVLLRTLATPRWLADGAIVVVERSVRGGGPRWPDAIEALQDRRYGDGVLWYGRQR